MCSKINNTNKWTHFIADGLLPGNPLQMLVSAKADLGGDVFKYTFYNMLWWRLTNKSSSVIIAPCIRTTIYQCQKGQ